MVEISPKVLGDESTISIAPAADTEALGGNIRQICAVPGHFGKGLPSVWIKYQTYHLQKAQPTVYLVKTPKLMQAMLPAYTWSVPTGERVMYLTFDDGPIPDITPWVLATLRQFEAKATFFCVGDNVLRHPDVYAQVLADGHAVGNHTFNHLNGWQTDRQAYLHNVRRCARVVTSRLFRPPYGRLLPGQRQFIERHFRIIMWDVLSGDFDQDITPQHCLQNVLNNAGPGSIVVLHDSRKAEKNLRFVLPAILGYFAGKGYRFDALPMQ